jgi:excinuclease ABC subunit C
VDQAVRFLNGESRSVQDEFATYMQAAAEELRFEDAALWRNRIRALTMIQAHQDINLPGELNADIIAFTSDSGRSCVQVFFMRNGSNFGNRAYFPRHDKDDEPAAIIAAFIGQFYDDKPPPPDIFVNHAIPESALITEALSNKAGRKVQISVPARGQRRKLMANAERNAREALARELTASSTQKKMLDAVQELFELDERPGRIEGLR